MKKKIVLIVSVVIALAIVVSGIVFLPKILEKVKTSDAPEFSTDEKVTQTADAPESMGNEKEDISYSEVVDENNIPISLTAGDCSFMYDIETKTLTASGENIAIADIPIFWLENAEKLVFAEGDKNIQGTFDDFEKLRVIEISKSVEEINDYLYSYIGSLERIIVSPQNKRFYSDENGILYDRTNKALVKIPALCEVSEYTVPDEVEEIFSDAFYGCINLKKIVIGKYFKGGLYNVFWYCPALEKIEVSADNECYSSDTQGAIYDRRKYVIYGIPSQIEEYSFPGSVSEFTQIVAKELSGIKKVKFGKGCDYIEETLYMFNNLEEIEVGEGSVYYSTDEGVLYDRYKTKLIFYPPMKKGESYKIPSTTVQILDFGGRYLKNIEIPDTVKNINSNAFRDCINLETVEFGSGLELIEVTSEFGVQNENLFWNCINLKSIKVDSNNKHYRSDSQGALYTYDMKYLLAVPANTNLKEFNVPDSVECLIDCFYNCSKIEVVNIGAAVESISVGEKDTESFVCFSGCVSLKEINVSEKNERYYSVDGILYDDEFNKLSLYPAAKEGTTYTLPSDITMIKDFAFHNNRYLESVYIHSGYDGNNYSYFGCDENGLMFDIYYKGNNLQWEHNESYENDHKVYFN